MKVRPSFTLPVPMETKGLFSIWWRRSSVMLVSLPAQHLDTMFTVPTARVVAATMLLLQYTYSYFTPS